MNRVGILATVLIAGLGLAACGSAAASGSGAASASPSPNGRARNGAQGELVQMNGTTLILSASTGDVTVAYTPATTFQKTSNATFQDISAGECIVASGAKGASGDITVASVRLSVPVNGVCAIAQGPGGAGAPGGTRAAPSPGAAAPNAAIGLVAGMVKSVSGTAVAVQPSTGSAQTLAIPTTVAVSRSSSVSASDLALHECLTAQGAKDSSGTVSAQSITIVPPGPTGCFTGTTTGGFGGGGRPGGRSGGAPRAAGQ
ncbi:MAG: hypothetical protein QOK05_2901 [Chloroflexota bacterium]|nr:hypothetical protein [Chloroflexota bacterium]